MIYSALMAWKTPDNAILQPNQSFIERLVNGSWVHLDPEIVSKEHAMYVPLSFVHRYFPQAQVVPLVLRSTQTIEDSERLAQALASSVDNDTLVVASVDFSHYLHSSIVEQKDSVTQKLVIHKNYPALAELSNDFIDSPQSLIVVLKIADRLGASSVQVVNHSELGVLQGRAVESSTSYFSLCAVQSGENNFRGEADESLSIDVKAEFVYNSIYKFLHA